MAMDSSESCLKARTQILGLSDTLNDLDQYGGASRDENDFESWFDQRCIISGIDRCVAH